MRRGGMEERIVEIAPWISLSLFSFFFFLSSFFSLAFVRECFTVNYQPSFRGRRRRKKGKRIGFGSLGRPRDRPTETRSPLVGGTAEIDENRGLSHPEDYRLVG